MLLLTNQFVSSDRLLDELWGEDLPQSGRAALQVRISQLRRGLARGAARLVTMSAGYVLEVEPEELDLTRFERLVAESGRAEPARAAAMLREALALWRGRPLADGCYESFAQAAIGRMEQLRVEAIEKRVEADLALGRHAELIAELEMLVSEHPSNERLRGQLMRALYRCGRQGDALAVYRQAVVWLRDELGLEPGPDLRELERAILQHDSMLDLGLRSPLGRPPASAIAAESHLPVPPQICGPRARAGRGCLVAAARRDRMLTLTGPEAAARHGLRSGQVNKRPPTTATGSGSPVSPTSPIPS